MIELGNIQRWFTAIMVKPGHLTEKISAADAYYGLDHEDLVGASAKLSAAGQIAVYAGGYVQRLLECMEAEFAALRYLLGEELFNTFVRAYLVNCPPTSPDLFDLGERFPDFLKASQNRQLRDDVDRVMFDLPIEIARIERLIAAISRCKGLEGGEPADRFELNLPFTFATARYHTSPTLRLIETQFPLVDFISNARMGKEAETPKPKESFIALSRKNYVVKMQELEVWQWHFLCQLQNEKRYAKAVEQTCAVCEIAPDAMLADLLLWLPLATDAGFVYTTAE